MNKTFPTLLFSSALIVLSSCTQQNTKKEVTIQTEQTIDEVHSMPDYSYIDSLMQGSHKVVYSIERECAEDLPIVEDEYGVKYKDNRYALDIRKDGNKLFSKKFTKADFNSILSEDFKKYGIIDGMRFNRAEEGKLYFNTCVSYPESDMTCPFLLIIGPDGSYSIEHDTTVEDEDIPSV